MKNKIMIYNIKDIAKKADIAVSTVSIILNGKGEKYRISSITIERVLKIAKELNYKPNETARSLRLKCSKTIGFILSGITNLFFAEIAQSMEEEARRNNYSILIGNASENEEIENQILDHFISKSVDGAVVSAIKSESEIIQKLIKLKIPYVFIDRPISDKNSILISSENYEGSYEGLTMLHNKGCTKIAYIGGNKDTPTSIERKRAYLDFLNNNNFPLNENWIKEEDFLIDWGYEAAKQIFENINVPDSIFSTSWYTTDGILSYINEKKIKIPEDIKILSFDDYHFIRHLRYPLITIKQDTANLGKYAFQSILKLINGEEVFSQKLKTTINVY